ncbi:DUF6705 family protein [Chryseobacterium contaminans]|uniref:DUF6705 family protein n=1 Tax=Chryseobacterium contaminans TaxID=1423959 RepID=UPI003015C8BB
MKTFLISIATLLTISIHAQKVLPLHSNEARVSDGTYYKDLDNELTPYIGTWKGNWGDKTIYLELRKIKEPLTSKSGKTTYTDRIFGERKIVTSNGSVIVDRITNFSQTDPEFFGPFTSWKDKKTKLLEFHPKDMCTAYIILDINFLNAEKTKLSLSSKSDLLSLGSPTAFDESKCSKIKDLTQGTNSAILNFPREIVLVKQ